MATDQTRVPAAQLAAFIARAFVAAGLPTDDAQTLAGLMVEADLRGSDTHGVIRLPLYVRRIRAGGVNAKPNIRVVRERPSAALIDGDNGMGHLVMRRAAALAIEKAKSDRHRLGRRAHEQSRRARGALRHDAAATRHDRALFRRRQQQPFAAVGRQRKSARHQPDGGRRSGAAMSRRSYSIWRRRWRPTARCGSKRSAAKQMPVGWMIDREGKPLTDPKRADEGHLLPIGDYKGYWLKPDHRAPGRRAQSRRARPRGDRFRQGNRQADQYRAGDRGDRDRDLHAGRRIQARRRPA